MGNSPTRQARKPTLESVAAHAGVGRGTASRVINGSTKVSPAARQAVLRAIEELGYVPNQAARALVRQRTDTIALVASLTDDRRVWEDPFYSLLVRGAATALATEGVQLLLTVPQSRQEHAQLDAFLTAQHVDGVLLTSWHGGDSLPCRLEAAGVPIVSVGTATDCVPSHVIDFDNEDGGRRAAQHLIERGRRRPAIITGPLDLQASLDRWRGFNLALAEAGLKQAEVVHGDFSRRSGVAAMQNLLARGTGIDAVFAGNDLMAAGAMAALLGSGRSVPCDVAIVGFGDSWIATDTDPQLTSVHQPMEAMGREAAGLILARLQGDASAERRVTLGAGIAVRDST
ncbi:LacI family transcriptional regulator [Streptomyces sp. RP5T]|nr:LacI family transcriptional regulator [Streptomyces sp. RP5T]